VRLGIRAQILLAIAALLALALGPLFFAIASLARASLARSWQEQAHGLGRAVSAHVSEARRSRSDEALRALLEAQLGGGVGALGVYDASGAIGVQAGEAASALPSRVPDREQVIEVSSPRGPAIVVLVPGENGVVGTLIHTDPSALQVGPLVRLVALYIGLLGLGLLVFAYFVLTRIVVSPLEGLMRGAARVATGGRELGVPRRGGREIIELGSSLATMTASLRAEEEALQRRLGELEKAKGELERAQDTVIRSEKLASVGRLAAGLAHEIGNPLSAILSFQELLLDGDLDAEQREFLLRMKRETERVHRVLRDLLDFARPARDQQASASAAEAVGQVAALMRPQKSLDDVELRVTVEESLPPVAMAPERLEQVLLNLMMNAADAVRRPGGRIAVDATRDDDHVRITVEDDGGGIAASVRDRLFEPFVTTKDVGRGTGLGLAICRGLVEAAGGTIHAEDGADGARFVLALPVVGEGAEVGEGQGVGGV
jgi:two-component system, NtrC family, sensor kinase